VTVPNLLSGLRILLTPFVVLGIVREDPVLAGGCLGAALATDFLDGWLARRQEAFSPLGRILDPVADKILAAGVLVALVATGRVPRELAIVVVLRDVVLLAFGWIRLRMGEPAPPAGPLGKVAFAVLGAYLAGEVIGIAWPVWAPAAVGALYVGAGVAYAGRVPGFFAPGRVVRGDR
jgi:CDP-diacylglycerol--glycerol-3-phosphate 3-phosphatidyltransferase